MYIFVERGRITGVVTNPFVTSGLLCIPEDHFPAPTPRKGDVVNESAIVWEMPSNAAVREMIAILAASAGAPILLTDPHSVLPPSHTIDVTPLSCTLDLQNETLQMTYTVGARTYYVNQDGILSATPIPVIRNTDGTRSEWRTKDWWIARGVLATIPASALTRIDWTNTIMTEINRNPTFPGGDLIRDASHFDKAHTAFEIGHNVPSPSLGMQTATMRACRDVEIESRRTAFARSIMAVINQARVATDKDEVEDDAVALGDYVLAALDGVGRNEANEATLRTLRTRMQDDLRSRTPTTFDRAKGAAVGAAVNAEEHATLTVHVHCLVSDVVGVPEPIDLISLEKKRFRLRTDVADTGVKIKVPDPLADVSDRSAVALELVSSGSTPLQRRFEGQTAWHAWINPTLGDLLVAGRNQTVWFRPEPEGADADA